MVSIISGKTLLDIVSSGYFIWWSFLVIWCITGFSSWFSGFPNVYPSPLKNLEQLSCWYLAMNYSKGLANEFTCMNLSHQYVQLPRYGVTVIHVFFTSGIDYCNSLLYGISDYNINCLQRIQNSAARIVTHTLKFDHIIPVLQNLHWLPVGHCIFSRFY